MKKSQNHSQDKRVLTGKPNHSDTEMLQIKGSKTADNIQDDNFTMEEKCFVCRKKQEVNEPFTTLEIGDGHISFCSKKCENIHYHYGKNMMKIGEKKALSLQKQKCEDCAEGNHYLRKVQEQEQKFEEILDEIGEKFYYSSEVDGVDGVDLKLKDLEEYQEFKEQKLGEMRDEMKNRVLVKPIKPKTDEEILKEVLYSDLCEFQPPKKIIQTEKEFIDYFLPILKLIINKSISLTREAGKKSIQDEDKEFLKRKTRETWLNKGFKAGKSEARKEFKEILVKIASKFGVRETLLALGDFKDIDISEDELKQKLEGKE